MIEPLEPSKETKQKFVAVDIENERDGSVLAIGMSYRHGGAIVHKQFGGWQEWFDFIRPLATVRKEWRTFHAHNGGGWDWVSLVEFLLRNAREQYGTIEGVRVQSKIVILRVHVPRNDGNTKRTRFCLRFVDSLYLLRSSLEKLADKLLGEGKLKTDGKMAWEIFRTDRSLFDRYLARDCEALLLILEKTLEIIRSKVAKIDALGMTIGSTAMKVWRTGFLKKSISIPTMPRLKEMLREGYRGGRVEVFRHGEFKNVSVYDVNSLYPTAMVHCRVPVSDRGDYTSIFRWRLPGVYRIEFNQRNRAIPPILLVNGSGSYEGKGVYFTPEIYRLFQLDSRADIRLVEGYAFHDSSLPFVEYVQNLYGLRRSDSGGPIDLLAKYLLNSLYGKLGQRGERHQYIMFADPREAVEALKSGRKLIELNETFSTWDETTETHVNFEHVGIAGMITSFARVLLYDGLRAAGRDLIYCDTDSVHTTGKLPGSLTNDGTNLGDFRCEFVGSGVYCGRKLYALRDAAGKEKVRAKGVSVGGRNGAYLDYDTMVRISQGETVECRYFQPATPNEVIQLGYRSCEFRPRKRRLKVTGK
jgi:hypothetical protein